MTAAPAMAAATICAAHRAAVERRCVAIVARCLNIITRDVTADDDFAQDLNADSLDMVTITMAAEEEFGIAISDDEAAQCMTVADMVAVVLAQQVAV